MQFSSNIFLLAFLPVVVILHFILPAKFRNYLLLVASLFFYAWGEGILVIMLVVTVFSGWLIGLFIGKNQKTKYGKIWLAVSVTADFAMLFYFKYIANICSI